MSSFLPSIEEFNQFSVENQQQFISNQLENEISGEEKANLTKVQNFLGYINEKNNQKDEHFFSIVCQNKKKSFSEVICQINDIELSHQAIDVLYSKSRLNSNEFKNHLINFGTTLINLKYPSSSFDEIYQQSFKLKTKLSTLTRIVISVFISGIDKTDMKFRKDKKFEIIKLDKTVTEITGGKIEFRKPKSGGSFSGCLSLTQVLIPSSVTSIGSAAFNECTSLTHITIPSSVTTIESAAFRKCTLIAQITIPSSVTLIKDFSFSKCSSLKQISFMVPSSVTSIGDYAFYECKSLEQISIPSSLKIIGNLAFRGCSSLKQISFMVPSSVTSIGDYAFNECTSLEQISIPSSVKTIGNDAFSKCSDELNNQNVIEKFYQNQLKEIISQMKNADIKDMKLNSLKNYIVHEINQIGEKSSKCNNYKQCYEMVHHFLDIITNDEHNLIEIGEITDVNEKPNIKLYNSILWFSNIKALIDKINDPNNHNVLIDIIELNKYPEMHSTVHFFIKKLMEFSSEDIFIINDDVKGIANSMLKAQFLMKLENIDALYNFINDFTLQKLLHHQEINSEWIHQVVNQYNPNLSILFPQFEPQDLFYLFVGYSGDKENLEQGPLISSINCKNILKSIEKVIFSKPNTFVECADMIAEIIYRIVCNKDKIQCNHSEYKDLFTQELQKYESDSNNPENNNLIKSAIYVLDISDRLSSFTNDNVECSSINQTYLPFWQFTLRLITQNRNMPDFYSSTTVGRIITETIQICIKGYIQSNELNDIGADIFNLFLPSVPSEIRDPNYHMFYEFFQNLSEDDKNISESLEEIKIKLIEEFIENVCQMIFKKNVKEFFKKPFGNLTDKNSAFIYDPNMFINQQIKALVQNKYLDFRESQFFKAIKSNAIQIENLRSQIEVSIETENNSKKESFIHEENVRRELELNRLKSNIKMDIDSYNDKIHSLKSFQQDQINSLESFTNVLTKFSDIVNELNEITDRLNPILPDLVKVNDDPLIIYKPQWPDYTDLSLFSDKNKKKPIMHLKCNNKYFFPESVYIATLSNTKVYTHNLIYKKLIWVPVYFNLISEEQNDLDEICTKNYRFITRRLPILIFGGFQMESNIFIKNLKSTINVFSSFLKDIEESIQNEEIKKEIFSIPNQIRNKFLEISSLLTVNFTDCSECPIVQDQLNELKQIFSQLINYTDSFEKEMKTIYDYYLLFPNLKCNQNFFRYSFKLPLPSQEKAITQKFHIFYKSVKIGDIEKKIKLNFEESDLNESNEIDVSARDSLNDSQNKINEIKKGINNNVLRQQPHEEEKHQSYLISVCSKPEPYSLEQSNKITQNFSEHMIKITQSSLNDSLSITNLPEIVIPSESEWKSLSIQSLNKLYQTYTKGTILLPIYLKNIKQESHEMYQSAEEYFLKLLQIYEPLSYRDYSFIADSVNTFMISFTSMVNILEKAGANFHGLVKKKMTIEPNLQTFIQIPEKSQLLGGQ